MTDILSTLGPWVGLLITIGFWSYLYKENPLFSIVEFTFIGFATAHATVMAIKMLQSKVFNPILNNEYTYLIPLILGLLLYTRYSDRVRPLSRIPVCLMVGVGTGVSVRAMVKAQLLEQIQATIWPKDPYNGILIAILTASTVVYFVFTSTEHIPKSMLPIYDGVRKIGRIAIMVAMGAAFGTLCVTRYTMAISRIIAAVNLLLGRG